jgi:hypothetical protein
VAWMHWRWRTSGKRTPEYDAKSFLSAGILLSASCLTGQLHIHEVCQQWLAVDAENEDSSCQLTSTAYGLSTHTRSSCPIIT